MSLNVRWSESAKAMADEDFGRWAEFVAFNMMFTGTQEIADVEAFAYRVILWEITVSGFTQYEIRTLADTLAPFKGTRANVTAKTLHQFLNNDIKRIAKERGYAS